MSVVINRKERFATEGIRFQRHNGDGTIPAPSRFLGFANTADLSKALLDGKAPLTIKIDSGAAETKTVDFSGIAANTGRVTVQEAADALDLADFPGIAWSADAKTGRLKGAYSSGSYASLTVELTNNSGAAAVIGAGTYSLFVSGKSFVCKVDDPVTVAEDESADLVFTASAAGVIAGLPVTGQPVNLSVLNPALPGGPADWESEITAAVQGAAPAYEGRIIQVTGPLAAALDFGNCIKHGGNGLEAISFFDDETVSIGFPKDIKDKEEIDVEGAKGTITRMVIGSMLQGLSPVVTLKENDYYLLEMIQGGKLNRETGTYDPPLSHESDHPTFWAEVFSPVYSRGTNDSSKAAGYERILLRTMFGMQGDVPAEAKAWATYAFNLTATEYTDENGETFPAWQEQTMTPEAFDALKVKQISVKAA